MKAGLISQLLAAIHLAITKQVLPSNQNTLGVQCRGNNTEVEWATREPRS